MSVRAMASVSGTTAHTVSGYGVKVGSFLAASVSDTLRFCVQPVVTRQRMQAEKQNENA